MVGRTPEFLGKRLTKEMKIAMIVALFHPFLILAGTALTAYLPEFGTKTLNNPGFHGFSEMLYEFTSSSANNGSGFEGGRQYTLVEYFHRDSPSSFKIYPDYRSYCHCRMLAEKNSFLRAPEH